MAVQPLEVGVAPACRDDCFLLPVRGPLPGISRRNPSWSERAHVREPALRRYGHRPTAARRPVSVGRARDRCTEGPPRTSRCESGAISAVIDTKPELVATGPNQTWSWDITRLRGPKRWTSFYLYVLLDIFSRYVVLDDREAALAATLIEETCKASSPRCSPCIRTAARRCQQVHRPSTRSLSRPQVATTTPSPRRSSRP